MENKCRICLENGKYNICTDEIFINETPCLIRNALKIFASTELDFEVYKKMLCEECTQELIQAYSFYIKVKLSESTLSSLEDEIEEIEELETNTNVEEITVSECNYEELKRNDLNDEIEEEQEMIEEPLEQINLEIIENNEQKTYKRPKKVPNFHLTSKVSSIISKIDNVPSVFRKRKPEKPEESEEISPKKIKTIKTENDIFVPQLVINQTKIGDTEDGVDSYFTEASSSDVIDDKLGNSKTTYKKRLPPPQPTYKVTMDLTPVSFDKTQIQDLSSQLNKIEDSSFYYQCQYCPKAFATPYHLASHNQKSHFCQHCLKGFSVVRDLYAHIKTEHSTHPCSICSKSFSTNSNLRAHIKKVHGIQLPAGVVLISQNTKS